MRRERRSEKKTEKREMRDIYKKDVRGKEER